VQYLLVQTSDFTRSREPDFFIYENTMSGGPTSTDARFQPGVLLRGYLSAAIVLERHETSSLATLLLLPSGYRVIAKLGQVEGWQITPALSAGWLVERVSDDDEATQWRVYLPDTDTTAAVLHDHRWHGEEACHCYRVTPPEGASDDDMSRIDELGGFSQIG
jgi:hypothetical protein